MAISCGDWYWHLGLASLVAMGEAIASSGDCAHAQVTPDGTLGAESSVVTPINVNGLPGEQIDGGATRGANLFHSFEQFSIPTGGEAFFNNALDIQNIIGRVTGASISNIDGLLRANGTANLFLINPNGIVFGPNASLNIGGSFVGSTASAVNFADGTSFSATATTTTPLLTVSVPLGLQYGANPGRIQVQGDGQGRRSTTDLIDTTVGLRVQANQTLAMVGGDVTLSGGTLKTAGGRIELGSVAGAGLVNLTPIDSGWALGYEGVPTFADIQLSGAAAVDASGAGGGDITVQGRRVTITDVSQIEASTLGAEPGGTLSVIALESVEVSGESADGQVYSALYANVYEGAAGNGGNLTVETGRFNVIDGAEVAADTFSTGAGGRLSVTASNVNVQDGAQVSASTIGTGAAGTLSVTASDIELVGVSADGQFPSGLFALTEGDGNAGDLTIATGRLLVSDGALVSASTFGNGAGGTLSVTASDAIELIGTSANGGVLSGLFASTLGVGDAGDLTIATGRLLVRDGAAVAVRSIGSGNAGSLKVTADSIRLETRAFLSSDTPAGQGNIELRSGDLVLRRGSNITTNAGGTATGGNITIDTDVLVAIENSDISANSQDARGGQVIITASGIFGTQFRNQRTPLSDITATGGSPELSGSVEINRLDVDPTQGLVTLPAEIVDASNQIVQSCPSGVREGKSKFIVTGRAGLPPDPISPLTGDHVLTNLATLDNEFENMSSAEAGDTNPPKVSAKTSLVEATAWMVNDKGKVVLTATAPSATFNIPWVPKSDCNAPEQKS